MGLELREGLLDGIEIGRVGRQVAQLGSRRFDELANLVILVGRQIVHDDDVAGLQGWNEALLERGRPPADEEAGLLEGLA